MTEPAELAIDVPQSSYFAHTLRRAVSLARQRAHRYITLEHLLLALLDDPDALAVLESAGADIPGLRSRVTDFVTRHLATLYTPGEFELRASYKLERVLHKASEDARRSPRGEVDGAFVLAAIASETDSAAAEFLQKNGLGFQQAVNWLNAHRSGAPHAGAGPAAAVRSAQAPAQARVKQFPPEGPIAMEPAAQTPPKPLPRRENPSPAAPSAPAPFSRGGGGPPTKDGSSLEDMLTSVREILDREPAGLDREQAGEEARRQPSALPRPPQPPQAANRPLSAGEAPRPPAATPPLPPVLPAPNDGPRPDFSLSDRGRPPGVGSGGRPMPEGIGAAAAPLRRFPPPAGHAPYAPAPSAPAQEVRMRQGEGGPAPARAGAPGPSAPLPSGAGKTAAAQGGKLVENIPRQMRVAAPEMIEVRIAREETGELFAGLQGRGEARSHDVIVTRAMSVMLRAPEGGFIIEHLTPETQWVIDRPSFLGAEPFGRWRWRVIPTDKGPHKLQLIISARSVDEHGIIGDTALPDQIIEISVRANLRRSIRMAGQWAALIIAGGILTELTLAVMKIFYK